MEQGLNYGGKAWFCFLVFFRSRVLLDSTLVGDRWGWCGCVWVEGQAPEHQGVE